VVLADDHPVVRDGLAAMVNQQADMEVVGEAGDGDEAIALYEQHRPDVMVLDLRMPKRDGVAVVQRVLEINPKACILVMTTYDGDEDIFQCLSQGAKGYLLKDAPRQEILSAIRAVSEDRPYTSSTVAAKALQRMAKPSLTQRELDVLQLVAEGRSNKDIARRLSITEGKRHAQASGAGRGRLFDSSLCRSGSLCYGCLRHRLCRHPGASARGRAVSGHTQADQRVAAGARPTAHGFGTCQSAAAGSCRRQGRDPGGPRVAR